MKNIILLVFILISVSVKTQWNYPKSKTIDSADVFWGKTYADPYRWIENLKSEEVKDWFKAQANFTDSIISQIPARDSLLKEFTELDKSKTSGIYYADIIKCQNRYFYKKYFSTENVGKLYYKDGLNGKENLLFDPDKSLKGTYFKSFKPNFDGTKVALAVTKSGAEISTIRIINVDTKQLYPDSIYPVLDCTSWLSDKDAFFYMSLKTGDNFNTEFAFNQKVKLHYLGNDIKKDIDCYSKESQPELNIKSSAYNFIIYDSKCPEYIFAGSGDVGFSKFFYKKINDVENPKIKWNKFFEVNDSLLPGNNWLAFYKNKVYAVTLRNAPNCKVLCTDLQNPDWKNAQVVIPELPEKIDFMDQCGKYLILVYTNGITSHIVKYNLETGKNTSVNLPCTGTVNINCYNLYCNNAGNTVVVNVENYNNPGEKFDYNVETDEITKSSFNDPHNFKGLEDIVFEEIEITGHDGVKVPLSIIYKKGLKKDGSNSCLIYGYGAYGFGCPAGFYSYNVPLIMKGVVFATAHVRGGGEKGEIWHKGGFKTTKPNTWKDLNSCSEYLIKNGYTSPSKLACKGVSAGGIMVSRAITERPDLYQVAICEVGVANMLRAEFGPNGPANTIEFGTVKDSVECLALYEMDGYQHVKRNTSYPATYCITGWNDPRVIPWLPSKFAAAMQNASNSGKPVLLKVNYDSGHFTEEKTVNDRNVADQYAFFLWQTGHPLYQVKK